MKSNILSELFQSKEMAELLQKMNPDHLRDDLKQELFLVLLETPDEKIIQLHERKELRWYTARIVMNMIASSSSPFHKKYRQFVQQFMDDWEPEENTQRTFGVNQHLIETEEPEQKEYQHTALINAVNNLLGDLNDQKNYDNILFTEYVKAGSAGKLIKIMKAATGGPAIPKRSILQTVKNVKERIKSNPEIKKLRA
jgi:hypothetical protein